MRNHPIDMSKVQPPRCATAPEAKTDFDTGEIVTDRRTGFRIWLTGVTIRAIGERKAAVVEVSVIASEAPKVSEGEELTITGLTVSRWEQGGRSGLTYRADSIAPAPAAPGTAPTTTAAGTGRPGSKTGDA